MTDAEKTGTATHVGLLRSHNEDAVCSLPALDLYIVADGMGGMAGGDVASRIAVETIAAAIEKGHPLPAAINEAHEAIASTAASDEERSGMATTVVAMQIAGQQYHVAWVGDSRVYCVNDGIERLTRDHSLVQELVDRGIITEEESRFHPRQNVIRRALGSTGEAEPGVDERRGTIKAGDVFILCTDGFHGEFEDKDIRRMVTGVDCAQAAADTLVQKALDAGGKDNVSVIVVKAG